MPIRRFIGKYWIAYYISYLAGLAVLLVLSWSSPRWNTDWLGLLADIFGVAMGAALAFTIVTEGVVSMVLLIPATYNWIKKKGRAEGVAEGKAQGRKSQQKRIDEAYRRFGVEVDGNLVLPRTQEVQNFLNPDEWEDLDSE